MSITLLIEPQQLQPTYNPIHIVLDSTNKAKEKFQFIVDITINGTTPVPALEFQPDPTGYGVKDLSSHIASHISYDVTNPLTDLTEVKKATNSFAEYSVTLSEEYIPTIVVTGITDIGGGWLEVGTATPHGLSVGDRFHLRNMTNIAYDGTFTNLANNGANAFAFALTFDGTSTGEMRNATEPITTFTSSTVFSNTKIAFNGVEDWVDFASYNNEDFDVLDIDDARLLTSLTSYADAAPTTLAGWKGAYEVTSNSRMYLNFWNKNEHFAFAQIGAYDSNGTLIGTVNSDGMATGTTNDLVGRLAVGPWNVNNSGNVSGYSSDFLTGATYYYVQTEVSAHYLFKIVDECTRFETYQLLFLDSLGSFIPVTFNLMSSKAVSVNKTSYRKNSGGYDPVTNTYGYNTYDRGKTRLATETTEVITVNSDWVTEAQSDIINQIYESPEVYHINQDGQMFAIDILNPNYVPKTRLNDKMINFELQFEYSYKNANQS